MPVPEFAAAFCRDVKPGHVALAAALSRYIREHKQIDVPLDAFRAEQLPPHLAMNFRVLDEHGRQLGMSRNFASLHAELAPKAAPVPVAAAQGGKEHESTQRYASWSFGEFVPTREVSRAGQNVTLYNALVDEGDAVVLRAFDTQDAAQNAHRAGLRRLFMLQMKEQVKHLEKNLPDALGMLFMPFGTQQELKQQILAMTFDRCCLSDPLPVHEAQFVARAKEAKSRLLLIAQELTRLITTILNEHHALQKSLPQLKNQNQAHQDIKAQLEWLLNPHFIRDTPYERLQHLPRYLKAIALRIEKLRSNPARDAQCMTQMQPLLQALQKFRQAGKPDPRIEEFAWLMQELRVSLFAQELKTPVIVSVKRLEKMLAAMKY